MKGDKHMKTITNIIHGAFALFAFGALALAPTARAVLPSPTPDGGYPNQNTAEGTGALFQGSGAWNTALGYQALTNHGSGGSYNTATGANALWDDFSGTYNTATGFEALYEGGTANTATGAFALLGAPQDLGGNGTYNTADGFKALTHNTDGSRNTATGAFALFGNQTTSDGSGSNNTADGCQALYNSATGGDNTAVGYRALFSNATGDDNTAIGHSALYSNLNGFGNTATGVAALLHNNGINNTADGAYALNGNTSGANNVALGFQAGENLTTGSGNVCIGAGVGGIAGENNTTRIRNVYSSVASARAVYVNSNNKIGALSSSRRYKEDIQPMDKASEALFALMPVTFRYKKDVDPAQALAFGLIAEDVAEINPDLITRDEDGKPQTVRYEAVNAMLLNEFLKEHKTVEEQGAMIARQQKQIEALTAGLQNVSAQLELSKAGPHTVANGQ
jgi:Chaperone of endosialidase